MAEEVHLSSSSSSPLIPHSPLPCDSGDRILLLQGRPYFNFVNSIKSPETRKSYIFALKKYMQFHGYKAIDELLVDKNNPTIIEDKIIDWLVALRKEDASFKMAFNTRHGYLAAILTFYEINDVNIRKKKVARYLGEEVKRKQKDRAYTVEEIKKLLDYADLRSKVVVLLLASTGMRIGALSELKIKHLKKIPEYNLYQIVIYKNAKEEHFTFCTPECAKAIDEYIEYRQKSGEKITEEAPVIRERFDRIDIETTKKPEPMATRGIGQILYVLLTKSGLNEIKHSTQTRQIKKGSERKEVKRAHGFRKFFDTNLMRAKVSLTIKEMLLGHSIGLDNNYYRPREEELLQEYLKAVDYLTINNENRLQKKVEELTQKQDDVELMRLEQRQKDKRLEELEKNLQEQRMAQQKQQELLEALWLHQQKQEHEEQQFYGHDEYNNSVPKVTRYVLKGKGRNLTQSEDKQEEEFEAKTFVLEENRNNYTNSCSADTASPLSEEEIEKLPWTLIPRRRIGRVTTTIKEQGQRQEFDNSDGK